MTLYLLIALSWLLVALALVVFRIVDERDPESQWRLLLVAAAAPFVLFPVVRVCSFLLEGAATRVPWADSVWPLALLTAGGGAVAVVRGAVILRRQRALLAACRPADGTDGDALRGRLQRLSQAAGLRRVPELLLYPRGAHVCALGGRRSVIILSRDLLTALGDEELDAVLGHELAHLRQGDYRLNWLGLLGRSLLFYLPPWALGWRILAEAREWRADRLTVAYTGDPLALAAALIKVWQYQPPRLVAVGAGELLQRSGNLEARVRRLLDPTSSVRPLRRFSLSAALLLGAFVFVHATVEGGTHILARVSAGMAEWEACCDPEVSPFPHCAGPRLGFLGARHHDA